MVRKPKVEQNDDMAKDGCHCILITVATYCNVRGRDPQAENEMFVRSPDCHFSQH